MCLPEKEFYEIGADESVAATFHQDVQDAMEHLASESPFAPDDDGSPDMV